MNTNQAQKMNDKIKKIQATMKASLDPYKDYTRVIILGLTGSGKSSLASCLSKNNLTIQENDRKQRILVGKGICTGCKVGTKVPVIYPDHENKLLYCDSPGFEDLRGNEDEIINAFTCDYLLKSDEYDIKVKILFVISYFELYANRGKGILENFQRLKRMFPDSEDLKKIMGIVITKGEADFSGKNFFEELGEKASAELKKWCDFYIVFCDRVYIFPMAIKEDVGKQYDFFDHQRLIDSLLTDYTINPKHKITVSIECLNELNYIRSVHFNEINYTVRELYHEVDEEFRKTKNSDSLKFWLECMHQLLQQNIKKTNNFYEAFQRIVPNSQKYSKYFKKLENYEVFDSFIDRINGTEKATSCLLESFTSLTLSAIREIEKQMELVQKSEYQDKMIKEKDELIVQNNKNLQKQKNEIMQLNMANENQRKTIRRNQEENERKIRQIQEDAFLRETILYEKQVETENKLTKIENEHKNDINYYNQQLNASNNKMQQMKNDFSKKEHSLSNEISEYKRKFSNIRDDFMNEKRSNESEKRYFKEMIENLKKTIDKQSNQITALRNRKPVVVYEDDGCFIS